LDLTTPAIAMPTGSAIGTLNYEASSTGYRRTDGYERFDGRTSPSEASFWMLEIDNVTGTFPLHSTVTGATSGATGKVLLASTLGSTEIGLGAVTGTFVNNENLQVSGVTKATANGTAVKSLSPDDDTATAWQLQATADARAVIAAVPGSGPVRGVWEYDEEVYAFRDNAGATAGAMWRATTAGWVEVTFGRSIDFTSGGTAEITEGVTITGATSGATALVRRVVIVSGTWPAGDAAGYLVLSGQTGTFQAENINLNTSPNVATIASNSATITLPAGGRYRFINHNFYATSGFRRMYGVNGVGRAFEFDGTTLSFIRSGVTDDAPIRIASHRQHLVLAHAGGSLVGSVPGEPMSFNGTFGAFEIGVGDEITDFIPSTSTVLTILCENSVSMLYGNDAADFQLEVLTDEAGALPHTAERMGVPVYMDNRGIRSLQTTQSYGNFTIGTMTQTVRPLLRDFRRQNISPVAAIRSRKKDLYRVFFDNGYGMSVYMGGKNPQVMMCRLDHIVTCICSSEDEERDEAIYFGSDNGFVYQLDRGNGFDGAPIAYYLRLPFLHLGAPQQKKRWHKVSLEVDAAPSVALRITADFDYADPNEPSHPSTIVDVRGGGGSWDVSSWNEFYWSSPLEGTAEAHLDGVSKNMSLLLAGETATEPAHTLQGMTVFYGVRGLQR
jgi:hypothetical protein